MSWDSFYELLRHRETTFCDVVLFIVVAMVYTITKKRLANEGDASTQIEQNIQITEDEFNAFSQMPANTVHKMRFLYPYEGKTAEIDVFLDRLEGLVLVDIEFNSKEESDKCAMPDFCLADVTNEDCFAG